MSGLELVVVALTLCLNNPAPAAEHGIEPRECYELARYSSRVECRITAERIRIHAKGARLLCQPRELSPDERLQIARGGR